MKTRDLFLQLGVLVALSGAGVVPLHASVAVVSNLGSASGESTAVFRDSSGVALAAGCQVQLVTFGSMTSSEISELAATGPANLLAQANLFGSASSVGTGSGVAGTIEFQVSAPLSTSLGGLHAIVFNAPTPAAATEVLVVRLPGELQADSLSGLEGHLAVHFDDAIVVYGERTAAGLFSRSSPEVVVTPYETWIAGQLGENALPGDLLAEADPDHDGMENLLEYAMGANPGAGSLREVLTARRAVDGTVWVRYLRRTNDPGVACRTEYRADLAAEEWTELESPVQSPGEVPYPAPEGCEWVEQALPSGNRGFARVKAIVTGS